MANRETTDEAIPYRTLGSTGVQVSAIGLGGYHLGLVRDEAESTRIVRAALDRGINFLDNSWDYHEGRSEERMGRALRDGWREKAFLMTKIDGRTKASAARQIEDSLRRLQTDRIDLLQFHEIIRFEDADRIFAAGGALEAAREALAAGKIRYVGFTGHKNPAVHLNMLEVAAAHDFEFDTVQMPLNVMDAHFRSFEKQVLPVAVAKGLGILGMKSMGAGKILQSGVVTPVECLHYALNLPTSVVITGMDSMAILDQAVEAVTSFQPMDPQRLAALLGKTAAAAREGRFESFKTSSEHDSTASHTEWLG